MSVTLLSCFDVLPCSSYFLYIQCFMLGSISDKNCALPKLRAMEAMFLEKIGIANGSIVEDVREENSDDSVVAEDY